MYLLYIPFFSPPLSLIIFLLFSLYINTHIYIYSLSFISLPFFAPSHHLFSPSYIFPYYYLTLFISLTLLSSLFQAPLLSLFSLVFIHLSHSPLFSFLSFFSLSCFHHFLSLNYSMFPLSRSSSLSPLTVFAFTLNDKGNKTQAQTERSIAKPVTCHKRRNHGCIQVYGFSRV